MLFAPGNQNLNRITSLLLGFALYTLWIDDERGSSTDLAHGTFFQVYADEISYWWVCQLHSYVSRKPQHRRRLPTRPSVPGRVAIVELTVSSARLGPAVMFLAAYNAATRSVLYSFSSEASEHRGLERYQMLSLNSFAPAYTCSSTWLRGCRHLRVSVRVTTFRGQLLRDVDDSVVPVRHSQTQTQVVSIQDRTLPR